MSIEKRRYKRINFRLEAEVTYSNKRYNGFIENFSESGIFKIVFPDESIQEFMPGALLGVNFQMPSGEKLSLNCIIKWLRIKTDSPFALKYNMGMEIIDPPQEYKSFIQTLLQKDNKPQK
jgi:hypothetical protein